MFFITDANDHTGLGHEDGGAIMPRTRRKLQKRQYSTAVPSARHHLLSLPVYGMRSRVYVTVRCPSVFLFQQGPQQQTRLYGFAAAGQCRQKISIACCTAGDTSSACGGRVRAVRRCQVDEHRLVYTRVIAASQSSVGTVVKHRTVVPKNKNKKDDLAKDSVSSFIHRVRMT